MTSNEGRVVSFVFIDLETTSIPSHEHNRTKITELSLVAAKRGHLLACAAGETPRVQHKLTLCLNPRRMIDPGSTRVTGLCNDLLEHETHFNDNVYLTLNSFLATLEKPVCLLAHNGLCFDFPILKASLERIAKQLPDDLLCADTLHAYNDILSGTESGDVTDLAISDLAASEEEPVDFQSQNETTPKKAATTAPATPSKKKLIEQRRGRNVRRRLTYSEKKGKSLSAVYEQLLKKPATGCHRAEADCLLNMEAAVVVADQFVHWVDDNSCVFNDIEPMRFGVALK